MSITLNSLNKTDLVQKILDLSGKVIINAHLHKMCEKIEMPAESMSEIVEGNKKLRSHKAMVKDFNCKLEGKIVYLEKSQAKEEESSCRNNLEI